MGGKPHKKVGRINMNILVLNGSPKCENSNTLKLTNAFLEGISNEQPQTLKYLMSANLISTIAGDVFTAGIKRPENACSMMICLVLSISCL